MTLRGCLGGLLLLLSAGCESEPMYSISVGGYQSEGVDRPTAALLTESGDVLVGALVGSQEMPEGGLLGYPALLRFRQRTDAYGLSPQVHIWEASDSVGVVGISESDQGLVVARNAPHGMDVTCGDVWEGKDELIYRAGRPGFVFRVTGGLVSVTNGQHESEVVVSRNPYWEGHGCDVLVGSNSRFEDIGVLLLADVSGGDVFVLGRLERQLMLSRIRPADGWRRWSTNLGEYRQAVMEARPDGVLVALSSPGDSRPPQVSFVDDNGAEVWSTIVPSEGDATIEAIVSLPNGELAASLVSEQGGKGNRTRAELVILGPQGALRRRLPINDPWKANTHARHLLARPDGKLIAVLEVDPGETKSRRTDDPFIELVEF